MFVTAQSICNELNIDMLQTVETKKIKEILQNIRKNTWKQKPVHGNFLRNVENIEEASQKFNWSWM